MRRRVTRPTIWILALALVTVAEPAWASMPVRPSLGSASRVSRATLLPFSGEIEEILVLDDRGLALITGGDGEASVAVVDLAGALIAELPIPDAHGMATDGDTVFVASPTQGLMRVDVTTMPPALHPDGPIEIAPYTEPTWVRAIGSSLWVSALSGGSSAIVAVDTDGTDVRPGVLSSGGRLAADPTGSDLLVYDTVDVTRFDVSNPPGQFRWGLTYPGGANRINDLAVIPGSSRWIVAASSPYDLREFRMSDGDRVRAYEGHAYPSAVEFSPGHGGVLAGASSSGVGTDVWVYGYGRTRPLMEFELDQSEGVVPRGLAWSSDASRLFVVLGGGGSSSAPRLLTLFPFARRSHVEVSAVPQDIDHGSSARLRVELTGGRTNRTVSLYERPEAGGLVLLRRADVGDDGAFGVEVEPRVNTRYVAMYDGEPRWSPDDDTVRVGVRVRLSAHLDGFVSTDGRYRVYRVGGTMRLPLRVAPDHGGMRVSAELQAAAGGRWVHVGGNQLTLTDDSRGLFYMDDVQSGLLFRIRTWMKGHDDHVGDEAGWFYFRARSGAGRTGSGDVGRGGFTLGAA